MGDRCNIIVTQHVTAEPAETLPAFPANGLCTKCGADIAYWEDVPARRRITIDDDGSVWVSGYSEDFDEAAERARFECSQCLKEYAPPAEWDWGS